VNTINKHYNIDLILSQVKDWPAANVGSFSSNGATGVVGHYTQLIWGSTKKVGCGFVQYMDPEKPTIPYRQVKLFLLNSFHNLMLKSNNVKLELLFSGQNFDKY